MADGYYKPCRELNQCNELIERYYKPCRELDQCNELIEKYFKTQQYEKCFEGHLALAIQGYPPAECRTGYFYSDGLGTEKELSKALYWTRRAAHHGDREGQFNLAWFCEAGTGTEKDMEQAVFWYRQAALQNHDPALEKCRNLGISLALTPPDREAARRELKCRMYPLGDLPDYKFVVLCSRYRNQWLFSRHRKRSTWETQGGHIEPGETPMDCAKRELFEESGVTDAEIIPVCDYWGFDDYGFANGVVFLALVHSLGDLPESEMKETGLFDELPENLTYPAVTPVLCREAEKILTQRK